MKNKTLWIAVILVAIGGVIIVGWQEMAQKSPADVWWSIGLSHTEQDARAHLLHTTPTAGHPPLMVEFTMPLVECVEAKAAGDTEMYIFTFGDGQKESLAPLYPDYDGGDTGCGIKATHSYQKAGVYSVEVTKAGRTIDTTSITVSANAETSVIVDKSNLNDFLPGTALTGSAEGVSSVRLILFASSAKYSGWAEIGHVDVPVMEGRWEAVLGDGVNAPNGVDTGLNFKGVYKIQVVADAEHQIEETLIVR